MNIRHLLSLVASTTALALTLVPGQSVWAQSAETAGSAIEATGQATEADDKTAEKAVTSADQKGRPRIGLALGGGGARGAAHVGVLKVLVEEGIPIDYIAGTSIGSVVGGLYASGVPVTQITQEFKNSDLMKHFMTVPLSVRVLVAPVMVMPRAFGARPYDGLYNGLKFRNYANKLAKENEISKLRIPFAAIVTDLASGESVKLTKGDLGTAMQASTAVPGLRKPVEIGNKLYCDGGLICNLPVDHVKEMGANFVIAVNIDEPMLETPLKTFRKMGSVSQQALKVQLFSQDSLYAKGADIVIHPDTSGISLISRKKTDGQKGIEAGEKAARAALPEIKRKLSAMGVACAK